MPQVNDNAEFAQAVEKLSSNVAELAINVHTQAVVTASIRDMFELQVKGIKEEQEAQGQDIKELSNAVVALRIENSKENGVIFGVSKLGNAVWAVIVLVVGIVGYFL